MYRRRFLQQTGLWTAGAVWASRLPFIGTATAAEMSTRPPARGPLRVHPQNPRYFTDATGKAVYLTGSHTWSNLVDMGPSDPPPTVRFRRLSGLPRPATATISSGSGPGN